MESKVKLTFSPDTSGFSKELGRRGRKYIKSCKGGSRHANFGMYIKSIFMALLFFVPPIIFYTVLDHSNPTFWTFVLWGFLAFLTGMGKAGNGEGTMHDSNHHSYFKDDSKNTLLGNLVMNVSGTLAWLWRLQHNFFHHTFTNVHGYDHDLEAGRIMRFAKEQPWKWWHRLQFIYAPFLYGLMSLTWLFIKDGPQMKFFFKKLEEKGEGVSKIEKKKLWKKLWAVKI
jgi:linoleoyl-CoA desaturase